MKKRTFTSVCILHPFTGRVGPPQDPFQQVAVKAIDLAAVVGAGDSPEDAGFDEEALRDAGRRPLSALYIHIYT